MTIEQLIDKLLRLNPKSIVMVEDQHQHLLDINRVAIDPANHCVVIETK